MWRVTTGGGRRPGAAPTPAPPVPRRRLGRGLVRRLFLDDRQPRESTIRQPAKLDAQAGRHITDRVEGAVRRDDLEQVAGARAREPCAGRDGDPEIAPVLDTGRGRAVHELRAVPGEQPPGVVTDDLPVADREELGALTDAVHGQVRDHPRDVLRPARVLHVEEDRAPARGQRALGLVR
jgi:hypothetical protein